MPTEIGYLIESYFTSATNKPMWLRLFAYKQTDTPRPEWTEDANLALRFGRESDAAHVAMLYKEMCCLASITEHVFCDPLS